MAFEKPLPSARRNRLHGVSIGTVAGSGVVQVTIGRNLCDQLGLTERSRVDVLLGTGEDAGRIAIDPAGDGWSLRSSGVALCVRVTARNFNLAPAQGSHPPFKLDGKLLVIDVSAIQSTQSDMVNNGYPTKRPSGRLSQKPRTPSLLGTR